MLLVIPCSSVDSPVNETTDTSSFVGRTTDSRNEMAAAFSSGSVRSCDMLVSIRIDKAQRQIDLPRERGDLLRLAVFENADVFGFQVVQQPAVVVLGGKQDVYGFGIDLYDASSSSIDGRRRRRRQPALSPAAFGGVV